LDGYRYAVTTLGSERDVEMSKSYQRADSIQRFDAYSDAMPNVQGGHRNVDITDYNHDSSLVSCACSTSHKIYIG
jgi:hypothetical protein